MVETNLFLKLLLPTLHTKFQSRKNKLKKLLNQGFLTEGKFTPWGEISPTEGVNLLNHTKQTIFFTIKKVIVLHWIMIKYIV